MYNNNNNNYYYYYYILLLADYYILGLGLLLIGVDLAGILRGMHGER